jgi:hypothetical protein
VVLTASTIAVLGRVPPQSLDGGRMLGHAYREEASSAVSAKFMRILTMKISSMAVTTSVVCARGAP